MIVLFNRITIPILQSTTPLTHSTLVARKAHNSHSDQQKDSNTIIQVLFECMQNKWVKWLGLDLIFIHLRIHQSMEHLGMQIERHMLFSKYRKAYRLVQNMLWNDNNILININNFLWFLINLCKCMYYEYFLTWL